MPFMPFQRNVISFPPFRVMYIHGRDALNRIGELNLSAIFCWIGGLTTASLSALHILEYQVGHETEYEPLESENDAYQQVPE